MRQAMASAEVGDDWYGDDPTVNALQDRAAGLAGRQAALFLPTGTMCNQVAMHAFVRSGHFAGVRGHCPYRPDRGGLVRGAVRHRLPARHRREPRAG
jgi:threonine aldolase